MSSLILSLGSLGCASYHLVDNVRALPGGYERIAIPVFSNKSPEVGLEIYFTENLRIEFETSKVARVVPKSEAQVILEGTVSGATFTVASQFSPGRDGGISHPNTVSDPRDKPGDPPNTNPLPYNTVLPREYTVSVSVHMILRRALDNSILWQGAFSKQRNYFAPILATPGVNASGPIYNQSSRHDTVSRLAKDLMSEVHDRMTENF